MLLENPVPQCHFFSRRDIDVVQKKKKKKLNKVMEQCNQTDNGLATIFNAITNASAQTAHLLKSDLYEFLISCSFMFVIVRAAAVAADEAKSLYAQQNRHENR